MKKTIKQHFEDFPEPWKSQAKNNLVPRMGSSVIGSPYLALIHGFPWDANEQGIDYWSDFSKTLIIKQSG